ncbi:hypothetical protein C5Y96_14195 [Blastopirellula marina]|uniref:Lipopolysaccharide biosynthesis protein n=1 Tax=Blastopirellula marina TaxID=124 RepID=A0A2S8FEM8_9BACT|nr:MULTISPECIES: lipopolysaccharide biosynthesis protein [Pirellulaceae]PQO30616.1 hypothetical protein C5Y96_14195 [Blastopirellula marina]RCS50753.1 lipopolysaccharide biosynthesis protein [Bremerella cremea]
MNDAPTPPNAASPVDRDLIRRTQRATRLTMIGQIAGQIISLVVIAELYRLVSPAEFGILGMFMPIMLLIRAFGSLGMDIATVQKKGLTDEEASTLFWYQLITGVVLTVILSGLSPLLAMWFQVERLTLVGITLSGTALLYNSYSQHKSLAEKKLNFGWLTIVRVLSLIISGIAAIVAAYCGWGIWALVLQQYSELIVLNIGFWAIEPWRPGKCAPLSEMKQLLNFSGYYTLSGLFFAVGQNLDKIILGVVFGVSAEGHQWIGYYTQAYNQMIRPVYLLTSPVTSAMLPALSQAKGNRESFSALTASFYRMVGIMLAPCSIGMLIVGDELMPVLGGDDWIQAGDILSIMGLMIVAQSWINISGSLMSAAGRADLLAVGAFANLVVLSAACALTYFFAGSQDPELFTIDLAGMVMLGTVIICGPYLAFCFWCTGVDVRKTFSQLSPALAASILMGAVVYLAGLMDYYLPEVVTLAEEIIVGVLVYCVFARNEVRWLWRQLRGIKPEEDIHTVVD